MLRLFYDSRKNPSHIGSLFTFCLPYSFILLAWRVVTVVHSIDVVCFPCSYILQTASGELEIWTVCVLGSLLSIPTHSYLSYPGGL